MNYWSQRFSRLPVIDDVLLVLRVASLSMFVPLLMRLPLERVRRFLEPRHAPTRVNQYRQQRVLDLVNAVLEKGRPVLRTTCLTRGVARYYFLRRAGVDVALAFGVSQPTEVSTAAGHCWLIQNGEPFLEGRDPRSTFVEVFRIAPC